MWMVDEIKNIVLLIFMIVHLEHFYHGQQKWRITYSIELGIGTFNGFEARKS